MFERILVATDESDEAAAGLSFATHLAACTGARLTVLEVLVPASAIWASIPEPVPGLERMLLERDEATAERLRSLTARAPEGVIVETKVLEGDPPSTLLDAVSEQQPSLLVAGTHGVGFTRFLLGSVSQRLLEHAPCDVLLFRGRPSVERSPSVLACLDGSEHSKDALEVAAALAAALSTRLVLTHVADHRVPFAGHDPYSGIREVAREHGSNLLRAARERVVAPVEAVVEDLRDGPTRPALLAACEERSPAIMVVGSRGVHGFHGLLVGSTARDLVNYASCPVLVVRAESGSTPSAH